MNDLSDRLSIDTPENILIDAEIAGFGSRCIAAVIDYLILSVLLFVFTYLFLRSNSTGRQDSTTTIAILALVQFIFITFYHLLFELFWNGQTPGKRWLGIRVVQTNGLPVTATGIIVRNLVRVFDFLPLLYGVGLMVMFASKQTQRLGDLAARTVVIREQRQLTVKAMKETMTISYQHITAIEPIPAYIHIEKLTPANRQTVIDYLQRRSGLRDRSQIAYLVAQQIARQMEDPDAQREASTSLQRAERLLEFVVRAYDIGNTGTE